MRQINVDEEVRHIGKRVICVHCDRTISTSRYWINTARLHLSDCAKRAETFKALDKVTGSDPEGEPDPDEGWEGHSGD